MTADWEHLDFGTRQEQACFAALGIYANGLCLTEGQDALANRLRKAPYLSAYHLAEWLAWNWWRLCWEPHNPHNPEWAFAHRTSNIGGGYIWPDITLVSDGERLTVLARATPERSETPFSLNCTLPDRAKSQAWQLGLLAAQALRVQENMDTSPISNGKLAAMVGVNPDALQPCAAGFKTAFAFALDGEVNSQLVLRAHRSTGRRFEIARLLADRLVPKGFNRLLAATTAGTYQQKMQRAFAAELLCPYQEMLVMLDGDLSDDGLEEVASHFQVSELTVRAQLANNGQLTRAAVEDERFALAA